MNIKIPRIIQTSFCKGCTHCSHYTRYTKTNGFCGKHSLYMPSDRVCDNYNEEISSTAKSTFTTNNKMNIANVVKEYLAQNKIVVEIDVQHFVKSVKRRKTRIKEILNEAGIVDKFYVAAVDNNLQKHLVNGENYKLVGHRQEMPYDDYSLCKGDENLFYWRTILKEEMYDYLYETYK